MAYYGLSNYEVYRYPHTSIADDFEFIWNLNSLSRKLCQPDLIIFLDVIKETALKRLEEREGKKAEIYDNISNFSRVHTLYMSAIDFARNYGDKIVILDANGSLADVGNDIFNTVRKECKIPISKFHDKYCH
jgi:thymidylate kinase